MNWPAIGNFSAVVTIVGALLGGVWFCVSLSNRMDKVEAQLQTISTAPTIQRDNGAGAKSIGNPIQQACADLAMQAEKEEKIARSFTIDTMEKLDCMHH